MNPHTPPHVCIIGAGPGGLTAGRALRRQTQLPADVRQGDPMKKLLRTIYTLPVFINLGRVLFAMSRVGWMEPISLRLARMFAWTVHFAFGRRQVSGPEALAQEWNRLMPEPRSCFPVVDVEGETAFVEIRIHCPLRGSGDAEACWRAMEFDRALMQASGGKLVVMQSQAVTGGSCCTLAIRAHDQTLDDLPVAHPRWRT